MTILAQSNISSLSLKCFILLCILFSASCKEPSNNQNTSNNVADVRLQGHAKEPPLTAKQKQWIVEVLNETDELDSIYKNDPDSYQFIDIGSRMEKKYIANQNLLPVDDIRRNLLMATVEAYQNVGLLRMRSQDATPTFAAAVLRKALLRKVIEGQLTGQEQEIINILREKKQGQVH
jgi:hypothetical protein